MKSTIASANAELQLLLHQAKPTAALLKERWLVKPPRSGRARKQDFFPLKAHFTPSCTVNISSLEPFPSLKRPLRQHVLTAATPSAVRAPVLHSWRFTHSLSNPNHRTGHQFSQNRSERRREGAEGRALAVSPAVCVWFSPSPVCPTAQSRRAGAGSAFSETISPAAAHYLWQLFLDLKWVLKPCCQLPSCHPTILWLNLLFLL